MRDFDTGIEGSLTIEAALGFTIFMFTVIFLIMPMKMLNTQRQVQMVLESAAKELSQYAYIHYRMSQGESEVGETHQEIPNEIISMFTGTAAGIYLGKKIKDATGEGRVEAMDFSGTEISQDGERIYLEVQYRLKLPFSVFLIDSVPVVSRSFRRGWIGSEGGRFGEGAEGAAGDNRTVYIGNNMERYHVSKSCHYLSNNIINVDYGDIGDYKSVSGTHYKPCSVCCKGASSGSTLYVMPNGSFYHSSKACSSITYYIRAVPLSEVEYLGACSYCGGMRGSQ